MNNHKIIAHWLFLCAGLVFAMIIVGAITRLTESGLSMVEWRPLIGALPPLSESEWHRVFELYKQSPEFQKKTFWMDLGDFKLIFFWEWFHRFLGRIIGLAFALPLITFWIKGMIPQGYKLKLLGLFLLGGLQGVMGWYMVQSGLVNEPAVSHYRLAAHLALAFFIIALLVWMGLSLSGRKHKGHGILYSHGWVVLGSYILTVFWGAYTAGLDAGLIYNETFPKMGATFAPSELQHYQPLWVGLFESPAGVQFTHRWLAMLSVLMIAGFWAHAAVRKMRFPALDILAVLIFVQSGLGIATLFSRVMLPLAALHQMGAVLILIALIVCLHRLRPQNK